ncbi:DNA polymerase Y family protein [Pararhizobium haloflavum]|uniref:DNA polymerase Y family protein n=1 Tax=Pararhizobium haloflavum TaxID=2037914 RepID=UPI001FE04D15|nr:DNA polymerase Y family protein [Pararhizobium haloflavum]
MARPSRFLALWFPFLSTDRLHRQQGRKGGEGSDEAPLVTTEKIKGGLHLAAVDQKARRLGLVPGLTLADARARIPGITVVEHDSAADRGVLGHLADACDRYTPLLACDGEQGLMLDISGCAHLFKGERAMLDDVCKCCQEAGFSTLAAIAATPDTARAVARWGTGGIVKEGEEHDSVHDLPVAALQLGHETDIALVRAGLKTVGDLADRPRGPLVARFGAAIAYRLDRILACERVSISPRRPVADILVEKQFAEPIGYADDIRACLSHLAEEARDLLEQKGEGGRGFEAAFFRADGKVERIAIATARPLREPAAVMRLFDARMEGLADPLDPGFGFDLIRLAVTVRETLSAGQPDFIRPDHGEDDACELVERLSARFSPARVLRFVPEDSHLPERAVRAVPAIAAPPAGQSWHAADKGEPPLRPLFLFEPPQAIETVAEVPDGPPRQFFWRRLRHDIARAEGPERIAPEWWRDGSDTLTRDYFRVEDSAGRRFWVYREGLFAQEARHPRWFLHGIFA